MLLTKVIDKGYWKINLGKKNTRQREEKPRTFCHDKNIYAM